MRGFMQICAVGTFTALLMGFLPTARGQDFDREARWRAEIAPAVLVGDPIDLDVEGRKVFSIYTEGKSKAVGIVFVHGVGVHPDHGLIGKLRTLLSDAGYSTLSIQMPVLAKEETDAEKYRATFPLAAKRIDAAAQWMRSRGYKRLILASHSMGAWMSNVYFEETQSTPYSAWVCIGITGRIGSTGAFSGPILDLSGENDLQPVLSGAWLRKIKLWSHSGSETVVIPGANHFYAQKESQATAAIVKFVQRVAP